jgi:hypothetical protein
MVMRLLMALTWSLPHPILNSQQNWHWKICASSDMGGGSLLYWWCYKPTKEFLGVNVMAVEERSSIPCPSILA